MSIQSLDHLILATSDIAAAAQAWRETFGLDATPPYHPKGSSLQLSQLALSVGAFLELAQPTAEDHRVARFISDRSEGMFSISLQVDDLDATIADLQAHGVDVSDPEPGAWPNTRLARIPRATAHGVAVQLIERLP
jgi:catechol 2,3-dioxygenase-like lactoylglutathione lyase family enzyme